MKRYYNCEETTLTTYSQTGKLNSWKSSHAINYWNQSIIQSLEKTQKKKLQPGTSYKKKIMFLFYSD